MHRERMLGYYPSVINSILEIKAIVDAEFPEVENLNASVEQIISDAYFPTMSEQRVAQWEKVFGIPQLANATLENRRNNIIARIRGQGKLNTSLINTIVKTFTGQGCECWIEDNTLHVALLPFDDSNVAVEDILSAIKNEIAIKLPAHFDLIVELSYMHWDDVNTNGSWGAVNAFYGTWEDVLYGRRGKANMLDTSKLDAFYLG